MCSYNQILNLVENFLDLFSNLYTIALIFIIIALYHLLIYFLRDKQYLNHMKNFSDPVDIKMEDLNETPLVNIIIPAWKEGEFFKRCMSAIEHLNYFNIKVIINAGGNDETIHIAESFKKYKDTIVIYQKEGGGKIKAINDALDHISDGIICLIDADVYLTDTSFIKTILPIINFGEDIVVSKLKPTQSQIKSSLTKYIFINRNIRFHIKFIRYDKHELSQHICLKSDTPKVLSYFPRSSL